MLDKLKKMADQAKEKAGPMAQQAKEKAGPMAEQAKEKAAELATKAAPAVSQGVGKAAGSLDKATKGRYTDKIDKVQGVVHQTAQKVGDRNTGTVAPPVTPVTDVGQPAAVVIPPSPGVIPSEPVVTPPAAPFPTSEAEPSLDSPTTNVNGREDKPQI
ncbi:MAG TPA: antitoxin [Jatrophihabitans sp.]|jgi:hypothetical protein|uniref:Rv0909 family putative TA system antitoxin n=1 Tax=Jatrophihabitans sp. TaxID=1932789 RepID=UPI002EDBF181